MKLTAADAIGSIETTIPNVIAEELSICIDAKHLQEALKTLPEQPITIEINDNNAVNINYLGGIFELVGNDAEEFTKPVSVDQDTELNVDMGIFMEGINKTILCASTDELRPVMCTILVEVSPGTIKHVASNGYMLGIIKQAIETQETTSFTPSNNL